MDHTSDKDSNNFKVSPNSNSGDWWPNRLSCWVGGSHTQDPERGREHHKQFHSSAKWAQPGENSKLGKAEEGAGGQQDWHRGLNCQGSQKGILGGPWESAARSDGTLFPVWDSQKLPGGADKEKSGVSHFGNKPDPWWSQLFLRRDHWIYQRVQGKQERRRN